MLRSLTIDYVGIDGLCIKTRARMTVKAGILYPRPGEPIVCGLACLHVSRSSKNSPTDNMETDSLIS
jgi:hypothetical protein